MDRSLIFLCLQISGLQKGFLDHSQSALACLYSKCEHRHQLTDYFEKGCRVESSDAMGLSAGHSLLSVDHLWLWP